VKSRVDRLLAKGGAGGLRPKEMAELARALNAPVLGPLAKSSATKGSPGATKAKPARKARLRPVRDYVALLKRVPWFAAVGTAEPVGVSSVRDWAEAETYACRQLKWLNFRNAISNRVRRLLDDWAGARGFSDYAADKELSARLDAVELAVKDIIRTRMRQLDRHLSRRPAVISSRFTYHVRWDLNFAGFEFVCQEVFPPLFFLPCLLPWYARGHFPCGWDGAMIKSDWTGNSLADLPRGQLRVF
jgi:hypothetical protein